MAYDASGNVYYCYIGQFSHSGIFINKSTNGGNTWMPSGTAVIEHNGAVPFEDKATHVSDWTTSPYRGSIYVGWTQFDSYGSYSSSDSSRILFSRSRNGGMSYSAPVRVSDRAGDAIDSDNTDEGAVPAVGPDGTVYMAWSGPLGLVFDKSTDGGVTWGKDKVIGDQPGGWNFNVKGIYRCNGLPYTKADISTGPYRGRVYVGWSDQRNGDTDVFLIHSDDGGVTWSPRVRVNTDAVGNGRDQFFPAFDVDPQTGHVVAVFYDRRLHSDNLTTDVYLAYSVDGGGTFKNVQVSSSAFVPSSYVFFGDYIGLSIFNDHVRPLWMRLDSYSLTVWTALVEKKALDEASEQVAVSEPVVESVVSAEANHRLLASPNPAGSSVRFVYADGAPHAHPVEITNANGQTVRTLAAIAGSGEAARNLAWDTRDTGGRPVPNGVYFVRTAGTPALRIVVLR